MSIKHDKRYRWTGEKDEILTQKVELQEENSIINEDNIQGMKEDDVDPAEELVAARKAVDKEMPPSFQELLSFRSKVVDGDYDYQDGNTFKKSERKDKVSGYMREIDKNEEISKRNVATFRLARILGLQDMIVSSGMTEITVGGKTMRGIRMADVLSKDEIKFLIDRIKGVQKAIRRQAAEEAKQLRRDPSAQSRFLTKEDWKTRLASYRQRIRDGQDKKVEGRTYLYKELV